MENRLNGFNNRRDTTDGIGGKKYFNLEMESVDFIKKIKQQCIDYGVKYLFPNTEKVLYPGDSGIMVSGYFDDKIGPTLACAIGKPEKDWYEVLIHESCHMDQWIERDPLWLNITANGIDCDAGMDSWLSGKQFHHDEYTYYVRTMQAVEIDCEKRSVKKILDLGLKLDTVDYIKRANSYLFFYDVLLHTRKWSDVAPYTIPEIINIMPGYFLEESDYHRVPKDVLKIYKEKCYEGIN